MVNIAIAGGSEVAREVIDVLLATGKHNILVLSRQEACIVDVLPGVCWRTVNYDSKPDLTEALRGVHTVLSFLQLLSDPESRSQRILIDAAIAAGVARFAPSEYGSASITNMPWWAGKEAAREYLRKVNAEHKILEYTLFQPGLFLNYLAHPYKTAKYIDPLKTVFDFHNCRAILVEGYENAIITLTTAADLAAIIARAVEFEGEWPEVGGIKGNSVTFSQIIQIGEKIRGRSFSIDKVKKEDLEAGNLYASWALDKHHQAVSDERYHSFVRMVSIGMLLSGLNGAWEVTDDFNQLFPDYTFMQVEAFLQEAWDGKPY